MNVSVQLRDDVAAAFQHGEDIPTAIPVHSALDALGVEMRPTHPGHPDPTLGTYFRIEVPPGKDPNEVTRTLIELDGVLSAYVEPQPELPG